MDILEKLFGSSAKIKVLKLFLMNPENAFDVPETSFRAKVSLESARKEISDLEKIGLIKASFYFKDTKKQKDRTIVNIKKRVSGWMLDPKFPYIEVLESFLSAINPFKHKEIVEKISRAGKIQLLIISGIFIKYEEARVDLLVVGDNLKMTSLENTIKTIESEIGKEIRYVVFETPEFNYRHSLFDKLVRDILDFPHEKIINRLNI